MYACVVSMCVCACLGQVCLANVGAGVNQGGLKQYQPAIEAGILQKIDSGSALTAQVH